MSKEVDFYYRAGQAVEGASVTIVSVDIRTTRQASTIYTVSCGKCKREYKITHNGIVKKIKFKSEHCETCCTRGIKPRFKYHAPNTEIKEAGVTVIRDVSKTTRKHTTTYMVECSRCGGIYEISHDAIQKRIKMGTKRCPECVKDKEDENFSEYYGVIPPTWAPPKI